MENCIRARRKELGLSQEELAQSVRGLPPDHQRH